jgi:hypothetical protein
MRWSYEKRRIADFAAALRRSRSLVADERRPRAELEALKQRRLDAIVRHVVEFQVVQHGARLDVRVVPREHVNGALEQRLCDRLRSRLAELGARDAEVHVERVAGLERNAGGKLQLVVADRAG